MQLVLNLHIPLHLFFIQLYFMAKPHLIYELNVPICDEHYYAKHRKKIYILHVVLMCNFCLIFQLLGFCQPNKDL